MTTPSETKIPSGSSSILGILNSKLQILSKTAPNYGSIGVEIIIHGGKVVRIITKVDAQEMLGE
jgi:hypothetical protein